MNPQSYDIDALIFKHLQGSLTEEEKHALENWKLQRPENQDFFEQLTDSGRLTAKLQYYAKVDEAGAWEETVEHLFRYQKSTGGRVALLRRWWVAASILLILGGSAYLWTNYRNNADSANSVVQSEIIVPGKEGAILTLSDGSQVMLDTITTGVVALQGGVSAKVLDGRLLYEGTSKDAVYNTMSTPYGRQYPLTLPDGTKVWLNAASSIRYPTAFVGKERRVTISGEVYFEVKANAVIPFHVDIRGGASIAVLGTAFNVNAYENEKNIHATLIEGSIRFEARASHPSEVVLKPGQQAQIAVNAPANGINVMSEVDIEKTMAWKNGLFNFSGHTFEEIMRQLERWYDIQVVYEGGADPNRSLMGEMTRGVTLQGLLKNLEKLGVRYRLEDRTLTILR